LRAGEFTRGLERLKEGDRIGSKDPLWGFPSKKWIANAERLVTLEKRLDESRGEGGRQPAVEERLDLAKKVCLPKRRFAEAAGIYSEAFRVDPSFTSQKEPDYLLAAVSAAVLAGRGKGADSPPEQAGRAKLLGLARAWIAEEFFSSEGSAGRAESRSEASTTRLKSWIANPALAATRTLAAEEIGDAEAQSWNTLWARIDGVLPAPAPASRETEPPVSR
jgi:hypothetical protein